MDEKSLERKPRHQSRRPRTAILDAAAPTAIGATVFVAAVPACRGEAEPIVAAARPVEPKVARCKDATQLREVVKHQERARAFWGSKLKERE